MLKKTKKHESYTGCVEDSSEIEKIVEDCRAYLLGIPSITTCHIYREANDIANRLAHLS